MAWLSLFYFFASFFLWLYVGMQILIQERLSFFFLLPFYARPEKFLLANCMALARASCTQSVHAKAHLLSPCSREKNQFFSSKAARLGSKIIDFSHDQKWRQSVYAVSCWPQSKPGGNLGKTRRHVFHVGTRLNHRCVVGLTLLFLEVDTIDIGVLRREVEEDEQNMQERSGVNSRLSDPE